MGDRILFETCPLCGSAAITRHRTGDCSRHALYKPPLSPTMTWMRCEACGHVFTEGYFTPEAAALVFSGVNQGQRVGGAVEQNRVVSARMVDKVLPYAAQGIWLDVGFGNGSLLFTAEEYGFRPVGADLRADNVRDLQSVGIEAHCGDFGELDLAGQCAVISMADVLEHMPFPKEGLAAAHRLLVDGGALFVSMPNADAMIWRMLDGADKNPYWGEIEHYHNFGRARLYRLLEETGFRPVRYGISERYRVCMEVIALKA